MSLIKNQFFEKKIHQLFKNHPYVLLFHYNNITSKEWIELKKKLFQVNPLILNKVIPNRFLSQLWKNLKIESSPNYNQEANKKSQSANFSIKENNNYKLGSSCLFFCSSLEDLRNIFEIIGSEFKSEVSQNAFNAKNSQEQFSFFISSNAKKFNTLKFLNKGMLNKSSNEFSSHIDMPKIIFFSPYDIKKMLELNVNIFFHLFQSLNKNENFITHLEQFRNFLSIGKTENFPRTLFNIQHYDLFNILNTHASKMRTHS